MFLRSLFVGFMVLSTLCLTNCSSEDDAPAVTAYQGAGSKWAAVFSGGNFTINHFALVTDTTPDMTVTGTYVDYATGFRHLTVASATGSGAPTAGAEAYGFEVPGFAFFLKPIGGSDEEPIVMIQAGTCPAAGFDANWIVASFDGTVTLDATQDSFGYASFVMNGASSTATIYQLDAATAGPLTTVPVSFDYTTCSNGVLSFTNSGDTTDMFFTSSGGALVHSYDGVTHDNIIFAAPKHSAAATQSDFAGTYSALVFDDNQSASNKLFPAKIVIPAAGAGTANAIDDVELDTLTADPAIAISSFTAVAASPGLFTVTFGSTGRLSCTAMVVSGTKVIACNGYGSNTTTNMPFFLLAKSR